LQRWFLSNVCADLKGSPLGYIPNQTRPLSPPVRGRTEGIPASPSLTEPAKRDNTLGLTSGIVIGEGKDQKNEEKSTTHLRVHLLKGGGPSNGGSLLCQGEKVSSREVPIEPGWKNDSSWKRIQEKEAPTLTEKVSERPLHSPLHNPRKSYVRVSLIKSS